MLEDASSVYRDGNAAAGPLAMVFRAEMTAAIITCAGCGATGVIAGLRCYGSPMGIVLRCAGCDAVVLRLVEIGDAPRLDLRGVACLRPSVTA